MPEGFGSLAFFTAAQVGTLGRRTQTHRLSHGRGTSAAAACRPFWRRYVPSSRHSWSHRRRWCPSCRLWQRRRAYPPPAAGGRTVSGGGPCGLPSARSVAGFLPDRNLNPQSEPKTLTLVLTLCVPSFVLPTLRIPHSAVFSGHGWWDSERHALQEHTHADAN